MTRKLDRTTLELLVLAAWAHEEISMGRAVELLGWNDTKIKEQAEKRVSNAVKLREERDRLEADMEHWKRTAESCNRRTFNISAEVRIKPDFTPRGGR